MTPTLLERAREMYTTIEGYDCGRDCEKLHDAVTRSALLSFLEDVVDALRPHDPEIVVDTIVKRDSDCPVCTHDCEGHSDSQAAERRTEAIAQMAASLYAASVVPDFGCSTEADRQSRADQRMEWAIKKAIFIYDEARKRG